MQEPNAVNERTVAGPELVFTDKTLDPDVVVAREYEQGDTGTQCFEDTGKFIEFLSRKRWDAVFDVPEQDEQIGIGGIDDTHQPLQPFRTPAGKMKTMRGKVCLDAEVQVGYSQQPLFVLDDKRRAVADKFQFHNSLTNPLRGW
jgi:hypothetical protein